MPESLPFLFIDKNSLYTHNQLYAIASLNIYHYQIGDISPLNLYKLGKKCLEIELQGIIIF